MQGKARILEIEICLFHLLKRTALRLLQLIGAAAADTLALRASAQGSLMEAMQRGILGHRKSPLTACLSPLRHLAPQRSNRKLPPLSLASLAVSFRLGGKKTKSAKTNHKRNRSQAAVNRHQHNYEETSADRSSNKRRLGFTANRNGGSCTRRARSIFPQRTSVSSKPTRV